MRRGVEIPEVQCTSATKQVETFSTERGDLNGACVSTASSSLQDVSLLHAHGITHYVALHVSAHPKHDLV